MSKKTAKAATDQRTDVVFDGKGWNFNDNFAIDLGSLSLDGLAIAMLVAKAQHVEQVATAVIQTVTVRLTFNDTAAATRNHSKTVGTRGKHRR